MSKSIQESLDLPVLEDLLKSSFQEGATDEDEVSDEMVEEHDADTQLEGMATALANGAVTTNVVEARQARDHETSMDSVYDETLQHAKDLMDLGYNVDTRSAARIFENAAGMYKLAIDAKNSKRDAQLKMQKLHLDGRKQDLAERIAKGESGTGGEVAGESVIIEDRNELIKRLRAQNK